MSDPRERPASRPREPPGADHRSFVGPADQYDLIGAAQFALLYALGLREHHRLLDIGCGSLRAGRMLIPYLAPGGYTGVEPNRWLIDAAVEHELGRDLVALKRPVFDASDGFALTHLGRFDIVLAQGVATNTGPRPLRALLAGIADTLAEDGLAAVTVIHPGTGDTGARLVDLDDPTVDDWRYPECYAYAPEAFGAAVADAGLTGRAIDWWHPRHRWWLLARRAEALPNRSFLARLTGPTLAAS